MQTFGQRDIYKKPAHNEQVPLSKLKANEPVCSDDFTASSEINSRIKAALLNPEKHLMITGAAGVGKTTLLKKIKAFLKSESKNVVVTATTGAASQANGGQTIHSLLGIIPCSVNGFKLVPMNERKRKYIREEVDVIFLDEVSMASSCLIELISNRLCSIADSKQPFGGKKIIFCGDVLQLPPVTKQAEPFFKAKNLNWNAVDIVYLKKIHRQSDQSFIGFLNDVRSGNPNTMFMIKSGLLKDKSDDKTTKLFFRNELAQKENEARLSLINQEQYSFPITDEVGEMIEIDKLKNMLAVPNILHLKVGALVVFIRNDKEGRFVNGNTGIVESIKENEIRVFSFFYKTSIKVSRVTFSNNDPMNRVSFDQFPLSLGYALTIHKSQGSTLDNVLVDFKGAFPVPGLAYTAFSRVTSMIGLSVLNYDYSQISVSPIAMKFDRAMEAVSRSQGLLVE